MKLLILYCIASLASVCASAQQVSISPGRRSFKELIIVAEKQTGFSFVYTSDQLTKIPELQINTQTIDLFETIAAFLRNTPFTYQIDDYHIILAPESGAVNVLHGRILNESGTPVAGATIQMDRKRKSSITNGDGRFMLKNISIPVHITVSGAEIETKEIQVNALGELEIQVREMIRELDETIILGYSSTSKRFNTGNAFSIRGETIGRQPSAGVAGVLQGRVPGLLITASSGAPAASSLMQIRGQHSINPNPLINYLVPPVDQPLIVINGIPFAPQNNNVNQLHSITAPGNLEIYQNPYGGISPLSTIDPADIESIEILKDAVTTSMYGSRAANGIIIITTKHIAKEKLSIETSFSSGLFFIAKRPTMLQTTDYLTLRQTAFRSDNVQPGLIIGSLAYAPDMLIYDSSQHTDWSRSFFHTIAPTKNIHSKLSVKLSKISLTSSIGCREEKYLLKGNFYLSQMTTNNAIKYMSDNNRFSATTSIYYTHAGSFSAGSPLLLQTIILPPNYPALYNEQKQINWEYKGADLSSNPAGLLLQSYNTRLNNLISAVKANYLLSKNITALINTGLSSFSSKESSFMPHSSVPEKDYPHVRSTFAQSNFRTMLVEPQLEYNNTTGRLNLQAMIGSTFQQHRIYLNSQKGTGYSPGTSVRTLKTATRVDERSLSDTYTYKSLLGMINLRYAQRYLLHFNARQENSSRFASGEKSGHFMSAGIAWIFTNESFTRKIAPWISFGKIRFSYGTTGNDNIGYNHFLDAWTRAATYTGNQTRINGLAEIPSGWSHTKKNEAAIELRLWNDRIAVDASFYNHQSNKQLISQFNPAQPGVRYVTNFDAVVQNSGWEFSAAIHSSKTKQIQWAARINATFPTNRLLSFPDINNSIYAGRYWIGESLTSQKVISFNGVDPQTGLYSFNREKTSFADKTPNAYGGISADLSYRKWTVTFQAEFRIQTGTNIFKQMFITPAGKLFNLPAVSVDHWQFPGDEAMFQVPTILNNSRAREALALLNISNAIYSNASYLRVKNLMIVYAINRPNVFQPLIKKMEVYLQAQNFLTVSSLMILDPELQSLLAYPYRSSITLGLSIKM